MDYQTSLEFVTVRIAGQLCGAPVREIREVFAPQAITSVPLARGEIAGLLNLRGRIVTVIDARVRLGLPARDPSEPCMALGLERGSELYGVLVDEVGEVLRLGADTYEPVPAHLDACWRAMMSGVHRLETDLLAILDMQRLIAPDSAMAA
ncbi:chemotaxis protein CheW [Glycocaulis sp.]